jgi:hypothetical protein
MVIMRINYLFLLGFPIINDENYGGKFIGNLFSYYGNFGLSLGDTQARKEIHELQIPELPPLAEKQGSKAGEEEEKKTGEEEEKIIKKLKKDETTGAPSSVKVIESDSLEKKISNMYSKIFSKDEWDFSNHSMEIWLHSYEYKFKDKIYKSKEPYWANPLIDLDVYKKSL